MLRLKLKEPYDQVFVRSSLENPSTGVKNIVDAKVDTGAIVTVVPMHLLDGMGLEILGERYLATANPMQEVTVLIAEAKRASIFSSEN